MTSLNRRQALTLLGAGLGTAAAAACSRDGRTPSRPTPTTAPPSTGAAPSSPGGAAAGGAVTPAMFGSAASCAVAPEQTEGPYYIDVDAVRADIREDRRGTPLRVAVLVLDADGCTPVRDAIVELWHCDAEGLYSGFQQASRGGPLGRGPSDAARFLRGAQVTNADGIAVITTIYPGWYGGRTVHIHAKVGVSNDTVLTTQLYFDDAVTDEVFRSEPYASRGERDTRNGDDGFSRGGPVLTVSKDGDGYLGLMTIGVSA